MLRHLNIHHYSIFCLFLQKTSSPEHCCLKGIQVFYALQKKRISNIFAVYFERILNGLILAILFLLMIIL